uniref:Uncharacterized protein n=1 Tax=Arundo donax TaxID=35708 RepID=A0A0A9B1Q5_ARUDO
MPSWPSSRRSLSSKSLSRSAQEPLRSVMVPTVERGATPTEASRSRSRDPARQRSHRDPNRGVGSYKPRTAHPFSLLAPPRTNPCAAAARTEPGRRLPDPAPPTW